MTPHFYTTPPSHSSCSDVLSKDWNIGNSSGWSSSSNQNIFNLALLASTDLSWEWAERSCFSFAARGRPGLRCGRGQDGKSCKTGKGRFEEGERGELRGERDFGGHSLLSHYIKTCCCWLISDCQLIWYGPSLDLYARRSRNTQPGLFEFNLDIFQVSKMSLSSNKSSLHCIDLSLCNPVFYIFTQHNAQDHNCNIILMLHMSNIFFPKDSMFIVNTDL